MYVPNTYVLTVMVLCGLLNFKTLSQYGIRTKYKLTFQSILMVWPDVETNGYVYPGVRG